MGGLDLKVFLHPIKIQENTQLKHLSKMNMVKDGLHDMIGPRLPRGLDLHHLFLQGLSCQYASRHLGGWGDWGMLFSSRTPAAVLRTVGPMMSRQCLASNSTSQSLKMDPFAKTELLAVEVEPANTMGSGSRASSMG